MSSRLAAGSTLDERRPDGLGWLMARVGPEQYRQIRPGPDGDPPDRARRQARVVRALRRGRSSARRRPGSSVRRVELLEAAAAGDEQAFVQLTAPLRRRLHAHCYRMLGSVHDADDALQETMLRAWRGIGRFEPRAELLVMVLPDRDQRLPAHDRAARALGRRVRGRVPSAVSRRPLRAGDAGARGGTAGDDRARVRHRDAAPAAAAARRTRPADVLGWSARETADQLGVSVAPRTARSSGRVSGGARAPGGHARPRTPAGRRARGEGS